MADRMGEFTRKFDRDILKRDSSRLEVDLEKEREETRKEAIQAELKKIKALLAYRRDWILERFPDVEVTSPKEGSDGIGFGFPKKEGAMATLEFVYRLNDWGLAVLLESRIIIGDEKPRYDYTAFPSDNVEIERAKSFIDNKIMDFARQHA